MDLYGRCVYCRRKYKKNPRVKNQKYCNHPGCQRARKRRWQRQKMATDPDYRLNQRDCVHRWRRQNPGYWKTYRASHPAYTIHNRIGQSFRNLSRPKRRPLIAKMDALKPNKSVIPGIYYLLRKSSVIAKMDSFLQKVLIFPADCLQPALIAK